MSKEEVLKDPRFLNSKYELYFDYKNILDSKTPSDKKLDDETTRELYKTWKERGKLSENYEYQKFSRKMRSILQFVSKKRNYQIYCKYSKNYLFLQVDPSVKINASHGVFPPKRKSPILTKPKDKLRTSQRTSKSNEISVSSTSADKKIEYIITDFYCKECDKYYMSEKFLSSHMEWHNPQDIYECFLCQNSLRGTHRHYLQHVRKCIVGKEYLLQEKIKTGAVVFNQLYFERRRGKDLQFYTCVVCPRKFTSIVRLTSHINFMHSTPKTTRYNCDICNYKFSHSDQEQKHLKEQHPDELIVCQHGCDKVFSSEEKMKRHVVCRNRMLNSVPENERRSSTRVKETRTIFSAPGFKRKGKKKHFKSTSKFYRMKKKRSKKEQYDDDYDYEYEMGTLPPGKSETIEMAEIDESVIKTEPMENEDSRYEENAIEIDNLMTEVEVKKEPLCDNESSPMEHTITGLVIVNPQSLTSDFQDSAYITTKMELTDYEENTPENEISTAEHSVHEEITSEISTIDTNVHEEITAEISTKEQTVNEEITAEISAAELNVQEEISAETSFAEQTLHEETITEISTEEITSEISTAEPIVHEEITAEISTAEQTLHEETTTEISTEEITSEISNYENLFNDPLSVL